MESQVGGLSRTIVYHGNRMDIGGHRFFSKYDRVMRWWQEVLPLQGAPSRDELVSKPVHLAEGGPDPEREDRVMLMRNRLSRIFYLRKFFDYPVSLRWSTLKNLGPVRVVRMGIGYMRVCLFPIKPETSLEDFMVNRFGRELYNTFFRDYTQKVWGVACGNISADWGAQRIKGLSIARVLRHAFLNLLRKDTSMEQKSIDTSLIEQFLYPKFGAGQLWETVAQDVMDKGTTLLLEHRVTGLAMKAGRVTGVRVQDSKSGGEQVIPCDGVISSLPLSELVPMLPNVPQDVRQISDGLVYRDFITVGLLVKGLRLDSDGNAGTAGKTIRDNWIYIQEPDVYLGRIEVFNNWSPYLVADSDRIWLGLEYFANEGDALWGMNDKAFIDMAVQELVAIGFVAFSDVLDATVQRIKKAYPAYFGTYCNIERLQLFLDGIPNLYPVGRNGMHRYNNMDHSMLSAMHAVACLNDPALDKARVWQVNTEEAYHESA